MAKKWEYSGDMNLECGGVFYNIDPTDWDEHGYCTAIRVDPCSEAGGPDNCWWIEELTVLKPDDHKELKSVLDVHGFQLTKDGKSVLTSPDAWGVDLKSDEGRRIVAECCVSYGKYDKDRGETIQIGAKQDDSGESVTPDKILRGNARVENYVKRGWLK